MASSNSDWSHPDCSSCIPAISALRAGKAGRSRNNKILESTGSGALGDMPPGEPLEAESASQPATKAMSPGLPSDPAQEAVHAAAAQRVPSNEQLPVDASGGPSASLGAEQVLLWICTSHHPICLCRNSPLEPGLIPLLYFTQHQLKLCGLSEHTSQICVLPRSPACFVVLIMSL